MPTSKERSSGGRRSSPTRRRTRISKPRTNGVETIWDAEAILVNRYILGRARATAEFSQVCQQMALGMKLQHARETAGLTQAQLAKKIGTQRSAISRLEDADYDGHSMDTLRRVADALGLLLIVDFIGKRKSLVKERVRAAR